jgi:hypothetical protein
MAEETAGPRPLDDRLRLTAPESARIVSLRCSGAWRQGNEPEFLESQAEMPATVLRRRSSHLRSILKRVHPCP